MMNRKKTRIYSTEHSMEPLELYVILVFYEN